MKEIKEKKTNFLSKRVNILGKSISAGTLALILIAVPVLAVATWILIQTTWIRLSPFETPTLSEATYTISDADIGGVYEKEFTITNPNKAPLLVHSKWEVYIDGDLIGQGYSVDDLQQFVWMKHIDISPDDEYGLYDGEFEPLDEWYPLIIPSEGTTTYNLVYHVPTTFERESTTEYTDPSMIIQIVWKPTLSVYDELLGFYDGEGSWDNTFIPDWY